MIALRVGKTHVVSVQADESRAWDDVVHAAGPQTGRDWDVWKVGHLYAPVAGASGATRKLVLVNFESERHLWSEEVLTWADSQHMVPCSPRQVFAVGECCPTLHRHLAADVMAVVSLVPRRFEGRTLVPSVWWYGSLRQADLCWFDTRWYAYNWFAFLPTDDLDDSHVHARMWCKIQRGNGVCLTTAPSRG